MKKWIIGLFVAAIIGAISTAALAGHIYYNEMRVYEDYQKQELDKMALDKIYIKTDIPVNIAITEGEPYIEFTQRFVDVLGNPPTYKLNMEMKGDTSYITIDQEQRVDISFLVKEDMTECNIYLPRQAITRLDIESTYWVDSSDIYLENIDIQELNVTIRRANIFLQGEYDKINIYNNSGNVEIISNGLAKVNLKGDMRCTLRGSYSDIEIADNDSSVWIDSQIPSQVKVATSGDVKLRGSYHSIESKTSTSGSVDIQSDTLCKIDLYQYGANGQIKLDGAFDQIALEAYEAEVNINTTIVPKRMNLRGQLNDVTVMLPSNMTGLDVICKWDETVQMNNLPIHISDFPIQIKEQGENFRRYFFGDESTKIDIQSESLNKVQLLDNGYTSSF